MVCGLTLAPTPKVEKLFKDNQPQVRKVVPFLLLDMLAVIENNLRQLIIKV